MQKFSIKAVDEYSLELRVWFGRPGGWFPAHPQIIAFDVPLVDVPGDLLADVLREHIEMYEGKKSDPFTQDKEE